MQDDIYIKKIDSKQSFNELETSLTGKLNELKEASKIKAYDYASWLKTDIKCLISQLKEVTKSPKQQESFQQIQKIFEYSPRFSKESIPMLEEANCYSWEAEEYNPRFEGYEIADLFKVGCSPEKAEEYNKRFGGFEISDLFKVGCSPEKADTYNPRFEGFGIVDLFKVGCSPEKAEEYNMRFNGHEIADLFKVGCSLEKAEEYSWEFNGSDIAKLFKEGYSPDDVCKYDSRFNKNDIIWLVESGCSPEKADEYDKRFKGFEIADLFKAGCLSKEINRYSSRFDADGSIRLIRAGCSPKKAEKYNTSFSGSDIADLFKFGYHHKKVNKYSSRFNKNEIINLIRVGCSPEKADEYNKRFGGRDIALLFKAECSSEESSKYKEGLDGLAISILHSLNIKQEVNTTDALNWYAFRIHCWLLYDEDKKEIDPDEKFERIIKELKKCKFLGTGASSFVLFKEDSAWKIPKEYGCLEEPFLLKKIQNTHKGKQKNIIKLKEPFNGGPIVIESIQGDSLENILKNQSLLTKNKIIKYASDILNGLIEMRQAGIWYHRDIRPANVMIDKKNDDAIIIDLGIATTDRYARPMNNRRYGGVNDLTSLGQIIYKMATGEHIFAKSKSMERTTHSQEIADYRDMVYSDKTGGLLKEHFKQINERVQDVELRVLIKSCLIAKNYHYKKIQRLFKKLIPDNRY